MSIQNREYELSIWFENLDKNGVISEVKDMIIAAHDMSYLGAARNLILETKLNGTHELTFQMPDSFYDNLTGILTHNDFVDNIFNETKLKLHYRGDWYEFVVKDISDTKHHKSFMRKYTCTDSFIDELSRNGYGITFDTELHNNVEEMGTFTREILNDSAWEYAPQHNWGDFTEYLEEKLFKIPLRMFNELEGAKINYSLAANEQIENIYTHEKRPITMGDDLAASVNGSGGYFWDSQDDTNPLLGDKRTLADIPNDGYIYVPYSQLQFCYKTTQVGLTATEEPQFFEEGGTKLSYAIAPKSTDPTSLIQFIAIPEDAEVEIDEAGLIVSKDFTYVMTVEQWNKNVKSSYYYKFLPSKDAKEFEKKTALNFDEISVGARAIGYEGYLDKIGDTDVLYGKKISITDRTEPNVSDDINQFVTVYKNKSSEYNSFYETNDDWTNGGPSNYRVCSEIATRQITPQLARNLFQNGVQIRSIDGWEPMTTPTTSQPLTIKYYAPPIMISANATDEELDSISENLSDEETFGQLLISATDVEKATDEDYTIVNFGATGQEEELSSNQIYCFGINFAPKLKDDMTPDKTASKDLLSNISFICGEGGASSKGNYTISKPVEFNFGDIAAAAEKSGDGYFNFYFLFKLNKTIKKPYLAIRNTNKTSFLIQSCELFKAYTKGQDFFKEKGEYRYSGRDLFEADVPIKHGSAAMRSDIYSKAELSNKILFETDIMAGDTYEYERYFIQQGVATAMEKQEDGTEKPKVTVTDTFAKTSIMGLDESKSIFNEATHSEDQCKIYTKFIDLGKCPDYIANAAATEPDCKYGGGEHICLYQKFGYCPYRFTSEKHCRKVRTLKGEKSNRFNLTQELSKVFEMYPIYHINHSSTGKTELKDDNTTMKKQVFYIREKGQENKMGFRYEKNLSSISRTLKSDAIVTKLYVSDVDSEISKTGLCSIKTAEDNVAKDSFLINLDYYAAKGMLDKDMINDDLYGTTDGDLGYLQRLGHLNDEYDKLDNSIINLMNSSTTELEANLEVNLNGIDAAKKEIHRLKKQCSTYTAGYEGDEEALKENKSYQNYCIKIKEMEGTLRGLVYETFVSEEKDGNEMKCFIGFSDESFTKTAAINKVLEYLNGNIEGTDLSSIDKIKDHNTYKMHTYSHGMLGQYNTEILQIQQWKKDRAAKLKQINELSLEFFRRYEPFLKEGTWSDSNYIDDNAYYFGAVDVLKDGSIPKVEYNISVVDLYSLPEYEDYKFEIGDVTYVEDETIFGINKVTGLPNRLKVLISGITYNLDEPGQNSIKVQNFTTQFEDLFQQVTATVQNLSFNENIYKRATNFTANKSIKNESLQGALDTNELTLLSTKENNIKIDKSGQLGSDINNHNNKYKLTGEGLFFSNNGGETWNMGVGPGGINADYIKAGTLDAGKVRIVDEDYQYFLWDKDGIFAYRDPTSTNESTENEEKEKSNPLDDFALFNKYGLSLVQNNQVRLRAGYNFNGTTGAINEEEGIGENVGFYLYDSKGNVVFATQADSDNSNNSASLLLKGEIKITNSFDNLISQRKLYEYSGRCNLQLTTIPIVSSPRELATITNDLKSLFSNSGSYSSKTQLQELISEYWAKYSNQNTDNLSITLQLSNERYIIIQLNNLSNHLITRFSSVKLGSSILTDFSKIVTSVNAIFYLSSSNSINDAISQRIDTITLTKFKKNSDNSTYKKISTAQIYRQVEAYNDPYESTKLVKLTPITYYIPSTNDQKVLRLQTDNFYKINDNYYKIVKEINWDSAPQEGAVALYLNNKKDLLEDNDGNEDINYRLLSCAIENSKKVSNIFSIQKDGIIRMGGEILDVTDVNNIPDSIKIDAPLIQIDANQGELKIAFNKLTDYNTGMDMVEYVQGEIAKVALIRHNHQINSNFDVTFVDGEGIHWLTDNEKKWLYDDLNVNGNETISVEHLAKCLSKLIQIIDGNIVRQEEGFDFKSDANARKNIPLMDKPAKLFLAGETQYTGGATAQSSSIIDYAFLDPAT